MIEQLLTKEEQLTFDILIQKSGKITTRDEIAQSVWGVNWLSKYSDWQIDRLIYLLRKKLPSNYYIKTLRNSGYVLIQNGIIIPQAKTIKVEGILPLLSYLQYMNNKKNKRKVLKDLFKSIVNEKLIDFITKAKIVLVINSYSYDNIDAISRYLKPKHLYFSNFDKRALKIHEERIDELKLTNFHTVFDDIRDSIFKNNFFDLVINDFRLNFNTSNVQNIKTVKNIFRILKPKSYAFISVVIDPRYESLKFGINQENAPTNKDKPWAFKAEENLTRFCFTVPYYKKLFTDVGFKIVKEFDLQKGKKWVPCYRRFLLKK